MPSVLRGTPNKVRRSAVAAAASLDASHNASVESLASRLSFDNPEASKAPQDAQQEDEDNADAIAVEGPAVTTETDKVDEFGNTGLLLAAAANDALVVQAWLQAGANPNHCNNDQHTAASIALANMSEAADADADADADASDGAGTRSEASNAALEVLRSKPAALMDRPGRMRAARAAGYSVGAKE